MDPQVSTSFIPKEALTAQKVRASGMGLFFLISLLIFILSLVAAAGAFGYGYVLSQQLASDKTSLAAEKGAFDPDTITKLVRMDTRLIQAKQLLSKHLAPSAIFDFLSQSTLQNVQFTSFAYQVNTDGTVSVELGGLTDTFATMALQSDALGKSSTLRDVIFSGITVQPSGRVGFVVKALVDPSLVSYAKQATSLVSQTNAAAQTSNQSAPPQQ